MASDNNLIIITLAGIAIALLLYINYQLTRMKSNSFSNNNDRGAVNEIENQTPKPSPVGSPLLGQSYDCSSGSNDEGAADQIEDQTLEPSSSATPTPGEHYEVFLSFRGEDTRKGFTDHLYRRLVDAGISVFKDNEELRIGETIGPELYRAIEASKISIPIISPDYASSKWCLNELVEILECMKTSNQRVLPIFYKVEPSNVRNQKDDFGKAFELYISKHDFDSKLVQKWKSALAEVSNLRGWESNKVADGLEGELVKIVVREVSNELRKGHLVVPDIKVGVEGHAEEIMRWIEGKPQDKVKIIGICGMGGIGKTILAKIIYNKLLDDFKSRSFVPNIREKSQHKGMEDLQLQIISDIAMDKSPTKISNVDQGISDIQRCFKGKKVLLLLDDVENREQLNKLAADPGWFGPQSIIIITSRNKEITKGLKSSLLYELSPLDSKQSFELFCKHAFGEDGSPPVELKTIAEGITDRTGGLPLALKVIGSSLFQKDKVYWENTLETLGKIPDGEVLEKLKVSYDALKYEEKEIFLDIACLPIEERLEDAIYMWKDCDLNPTKGIQVLISSCLIKIGDKNQLIMHDQLRDLGKEMVRQESCHKLGKYSRLWISKEAVQVLQKKLGTKKVRALHLDGYEKGFRDEHFEKLTYLRFLKMGKTNIVGNFEDSLSQLRWLQWNKFPFVEDDTTCHPQDLMATIQPEKLVILDLSYIKLANWDQIKVAEGLKVLNLTNCNIATIPDFSALKELVRLNLSGCENLSEIPALIGSLKMLQSLSLEGCKKLTEIPKSIGELNLLTELRLGGTGVTTLPYWIGNLRSLKLLSIQSILIHINNVLPKPSLGKEWGNMLEVTTMSEM